MSFSSDFHLPLLLNPPRPLLLNQSFQRFFHVSIRSTGELSKEQRLSPKKQLQPTTKTAQIRKLGSPNTKKTVNCRSPTSKKTQSPQQPASHTSTEHFPSAETSNAIQTARKLKKMLGSGSPPTDGDESTKVSADPIKRCNLKKAQATKPIKKQKRCHDETTSGDQNEPGPSSVEREPPTKPTQDNDPKPISAEVTEKIAWSRDEDRLLLEEIKRGLDDDIDNIMEIAHQFPNKTVDHIRERVDFLIDFLTKLRG